MMIFKEFSFDSAHFLPNVPPGHKCRNMHGHTYRLKAFKGEMDQNTGWIIDFKEIRETIDPIINRLDHQVLNEIDGLENPTCEMIAKWLWDNIKPKMPLLYKIELHETLSSGVVYEGK